MELVAPPSRARPFVVAFGECMIELSRSSPTGRDWALGYGGDCYNVAVYLARLRGNVALMTAIGSDSYSDEMRDAWLQDQIATDLVVTHTERIPGLYAIRVDDVGERSFTYRRERSAARAFFECDDGAAALVRAEAADMLYLSAITLSLFGNAERARIVQLAQAIRSRGGDVVFDTNYRPRAWPSADDARRAIAPLIDCVTIVLPTLDDDHALYGDADAEACAARWLAMGVCEVAVKLGSEGCLVASADLCRRIAPARRQVAVDTTGAGDAFNAGYLPARLAQSDPIAAAEAGNALAGIVVQHRGAIMPRDVPLTSAATVAA